MGAHVGEVAGGTSEEALVGVKEEIGPELGEAAGDAVRGGSRAGLAGTRAQQTRETRGVGVLPVGASLIAVICSVNQVIVVGVQLAGSALRNSRPEASRTPSGASGALHIVDVSKLPIGAAYDTRIGIEEIGDSIDTLAGLAGCSCRACRTSWVAVGALFRYSIRVLSRIACSSALGKTDLQVVLGSIGKSRAFRAARKA